MFVCDNDIGFNATDERNELDDSTFLYFIENKKFSDNLNFVYDEMNISSSTFVVT